MSNAPTGPRRPPDHRACHFLGGLVLVGSLLVMGSWWTGGRSDPSGYSTALGFFLIGIAIPAAAAGRRGLAAAMVVGLLIITDVTLIQIASGWRFGLDQLIWRRMPDFSGPATNQMGLNTAICFLCAAIGLLMLTRPLNLKAAPRLVFLCAAWMLAIAAISLIGHAVNLPLAYTWGRYGGMSVPTALGFLATALALFLFIREIPDPGWGQGRGWLIPIVASATFAGVVAWIALSSFDRLDEANRLADRTQEVQKTLRDLTIALGKLRTPDAAADHPGELDRQKALRSRLLGSAHRLTALVADNPSEAARARELQALVNDRIAQPGDAGALDPAIEAAIEQMDREADALAAVRATGSAKTASEARAAIRFGSIVAFGLGLVALLMLHRLQADRSRAQRALAEINTALRRTLALQDAILNSAAYMLVSTDRDGVIQRFNPAAEKHLGYSAVDVVGKATPVIFHDPGELSARAGELTRELGAPVEPGFAAIVAKARNGGSDIREWTFVGRDGARSPVSLSVSTLRDETGEAIGFLGIGIDLTGQKAAAEALRSSEEQFRTAFDFAGIGMAIARLDERCLQVNRAIRDLVGYGEGELLDQSLRAITHPDDREADLGEMRRLLDGEARSFQLEKRFLHKEGDLVWVRQTVAIVRDAADKPAHFISQVEDITVQKQALEQLSESAGQLREKNAELQEFVYAASHDLQEPLRKIQAFGDRLMTRAAARLEAEENDYLSRMQGAAARMQALIEALLSYSRVTTTDREFQNTDLNQVLHAVLQDLELRIEKTSGRVECDPLPTLAVDDVQLRQLFQNLIGNALKYHRPDATPLVTITTRELPPGDGRSRREWEFTVADNGIGFEPRYAETVFGVFQRLHGRGEFEGTGVGLAICRRIVERHGGRIHAESTPGAGSRFIFTIGSAARQSVPRTRDRIAESPTAA